MKNQNLSIKLTSAIIIAFTFISINSLAQIGINGVELPPACTNCDSTTVSGSKTASTLGIGTVATDTAAFASGYHTTASGPVSTAFGYYSEATGRYAFAAGTLAEADGNYSFAFGKKVRASASGSIVIGSGQDVGNYLVNSTSNSIWLGMGSSLPTMVIRAAQPGYTGKVGIGTSNPQTDLDVNGTIRTAYFTLNRTTSEGYVLKSSATGSASWADPKTLGIWLLNSTNAYYTGNVGIGTSTPTSRLQVNGTIASTGFNLTDGSQNPNYVLRTDASGNASWADPQTLGIWLLNSGNTILSSGNVGIGTSAPTSKLQVNGTIASTGFNLTDGSQNTNYILKSDASGNASWTDIEDLTHWEENLQGSLVTNKITGVNVPGDSSIYGAFQIGSEFSFWGSGVSENKIISSNYTWDNGAKRIFNGRASSIVFGGNSGNITFNTAGAGTRNSQIDWEYMVFTSTGRLGIGVNTPLHTLDVQNETAVSAHFHSTTASESTIWASNTVHSYGLGVATDGTGYIYGDINQNELLTFTTDGKVLVGDECNTPGSHKLYVNGTILTTEVKIATVSEWSDYVFLPGYHLPKLSEVEEFINSNGHLPGVPSQQEVKENGINLAETDAMLLKKIEELTLYILQQDKKISQLVEKIDGMEAR